MEPATAVRSPQISDSGHGIEIGLARLELMVAVVLDRMTAVDPRPDTKAG
jgi:hypothetical protein